MTDDAPLGPVVHRGRCSRIHRDLHPAGRWHARPVARKVLVEADLPLWCTHLDVGGVSTVWSLRCDNRAVTISELQRRIPIGLRRDLLASEYIALREHGPAWGLDRVRFECIAGQWVLSMPWRDAPPLRALDRSRRRARLPSLVPMLWDALADHPHGDLSPGNVLVPTDPDPARPVLVDPAAMVLHGALFDPAGSPTTSSMTVSLVTTGAYYPLLAPHYASTLPLAAGASLADHVQCYLQTSTLTHHAPTTEGRHHRAHEVEAVPRCLRDVFDLSVRPPDDQGTRLVTGTMRPTRQPPGEPHPADLLALGIMVYETLTGRHPFLDDPATPPAWTSLRTLDDRVERTEALTRLLREPPAPRQLAPDVTPREDRLARALLALDVPSRDALLALL